MGRRLTALYEKGRVLYENRADIYSIETRKCYTAFFVLLPILNQYQLPVVTFVDLFALATVVLMCCRGKAVRLQSSPMWIYCIWCVVITAFASLTLVEMTVVHYVLKIVRLIFYLFTLYYGALHILLNRFAFRFYTAVVLCSVAAVFVQFLIYITQGRGTIITIPLMELSYGDMTVLDLANHRQLQADFNQYRPSSFFLEPAWYALYVLPWLSFAISKAKTATKKELAVYAVVTMSLVIARSSLGLLVAGAIWMTYIVGFAKTLEKSNIKKSTMAVIITVVVIIVAIVAFIMREGLAEKMESLLNPTTPSSATLRLLRGWYCFAQMDVIRQLFGAGNGNLTLLFAQEGITTVLDEGLQFSSYMNGMSTLICSFGIVGAFIYLASLLKSLRSNHNMWPMMICWFLIMISSDYYDNAFFFLFIILMQVWAKVEQPQIVLKYLEE